MIFFNVIINCIEAFLFACFIAYYFNFSNKKAFIILSSFVQLTCLNLFQFLNYNGIFLTLSIILIVLLSIFISQKKLTFNHLFVTILYNGLLLLCAVFGLFCYQFISQFFYLDQDMKHAIICIISKLLLTFFTIFILKNKIDFSLTFQLDKWKIILAYELLLISSIAILSYTLIINNIHIYILALLLFLLIFIGFLFLIIIHRIDSLYQENQFMQFNKQKYETIHEIKNEISAIDHRLFYILCKIEYLAKQNDCQQITKTIAQYKNTVLKYKMVTDTGNDIFDTLYNLKINDMIAKGIRVKNCVFITQKEFYNDLSFINLFNQILDYYQDCSLIEIYINEVSDFVCINIMHRIGHVHDEKLFEFLEDNSQTYHFIFNIQEFHKKGLRLSFHIHDHFTF